MIYDITLYDRQTRALVNEKMGKPFSLLKRVKLLGIGSTRMIIEKVSPQLMQYLGTSSSLDYANIELRPQGIIIHFRQKMREYIWLIPYYHLQTYQSEFFSIHAQGHFMKFRLNSVYPLNKKFIRKMLFLRDKFAQNQ